MSAKRQPDRCTYFVPDTGEKLYYDVVLLYVAFVFARFLHELGHAVANVLAGGGFSLTTLQVRWFLLVPMGVMRYDTSSLFVLYAGPLTAILVGWYVAYTNRYSALNGPCGGVNVWRKRRGLITGFLLQALWDALYLLPVVDLSPLNGRADGDGIAIALWFKQAGLHQVTVLDTTIVANPAYVVAAVLLAGTGWVAWRTYKCTREFCDACRR